MTVSLRPYQVEAVETFARVVASAPPGRAAGAIVSLPTGTGKTVTGLTLARTFGRTLFVAPRRALVRQTCDAWRAKLGGRHGSTRLLDPELAVRTYQGLTRSDAIARLADAHRTKPFSLVIVDEAHHASAASIMRILEALPGVPRLGLTATPSRSDGQGLAGGEGPFPDGETYRLRLAEAIAGGWLVPYEVRRIKMDQLDALQVGRGGDVDQRALEGALCEDRALDLVAEGLRQGFEDRERCLAFTVSVAHAEGIAARLEDARAVHGGMSAKQVDALLEAHRAGEFRTLVNCQILTEGYDDPRIDAVGVARPTRSIELYVQMVGRGLRLHPAKTDCRIVDLCGVHEAHGLAGADCIEDYDRELERRAREVAAAASAAASEEHARQRLETLLRAFRDGMEVVETRAGRAVWIDLGDGDVALPFRGGAIVCLRTSDGAHEAWRCERGQIPAYVGYAADLGQLRTWVERRAVTRKDLRYADPEQAWRSKRASDAQLEMLARWRVPSAPGMRAGEASDLLDRAVARSYRRKIRQSRAARGLRYAWGAW